VFATPFPQLVLRPSIALLVVTLAACSGGNGGAMRGGGSSAALPNAALPNAARVSASSPALCFGETGSLPKPPVDDWTTLAHDQLRSGCQPQPTGITPASVSNLAVRWHYRADDAVFAGLLAVDGLVYVVTADHGEVVALHATDGSIAWRRKLEGVNHGILMSPTYDRGRLFVGIHANKPELPNHSFPPLPSNMYALDAKTGATLWVRQLPGTLRGTPAVGGGHVYVGTSGGDPPFCIQGGVYALDETNGAIAWSFFVDPKAGDGGSSWSPITYVDDHVVFGTGNTCTLDPIAANGVVSLDADTGNVAWEVNTEPAQSDKDVAGGSLIVDGEAITLGKDGKLLFQDLATGAMLHEIDLAGEIPGFAGMATPSSDGKRILIGTSNWAKAAVQPRESEAWHSANTFHGRGITHGWCGGGEIWAYDPNGKLQWGYPTKCTVVSTAAITGSLAFAGVDFGVDAIDVETGKRLWAFHGKNFFYSSPVVVPSGVYAADMDGNVYAFSLKAGSVR
jgi:outer membrane protein assembly factor BamB